MANTDATRARGAQGQENYGEDIDWENPAGAGNGEGVQGRGSAGGAESEDAAFDAGDEEEFGNQDGQGLDEGDLDPPPQPTRGENRFQKLARENAELRRQLNRGRTGEPQPSGQTPTPSMAAFGLSESDDQFNARIQLLSWEERMEAKQERAEKKAEVRARVSEFMNTQNLDKANWDAECKVDPLRADWSYEVEKEREKMISQGQYVNREVIFAYLYGRYMASPEGRKGGQRRREQARRRVESQTVRPSSPRSDTSGTDRRAPKDERAARARRLEGVQI